MNKLIKISVLCVIFTMCMCTLVIVNEMYQLRKAIEKYEPAQNVYNITIDDRDSINNYYINK
jgi:hypothetical protein